MKSYKLLILSTVLFTACDPKPGKDAENRLRTENFHLKKENDSLRNLLERGRKPVSSDTIGKLEKSGEPTSNYPSLPGKHSLTLQWIGWNDPGFALVEEAGNGWYKISGSQYSKNKQNYLKIEGRIKPINAGELEFYGQIESLIDHVNDGKPCIKTGKQSFKATEGRKYWRLQNMLNCEGNMVTDYVDIYF